MEGATPGWPADTYIGLSARARDHRSGDVYMATTKEPVNQMPHPSSGKVATAMFAMTCSLIAALAGVFVMTQTVFPWMTVTNRHEAPAAPGAPVSSAVDMTTAGPTVAERTLLRVMRAKSAALSGAGWRETRGTGGVPGVSFGFGCDPTDGLAPVVAQSKSWAFAGQSLEVSARAYPAGGGAVAFEGLTQAVLSCADASLYSGAPVGVESAQILAGRAATLAWRRGDVLMVATTSRESGIASVLSGLIEFDAALGRELVEVCANPTSGAGDVFRSPYVKRDEFKGNFTAVRVERDPARGGPRAEDRTTDKVVKVPARTLDVPVLVDLPTPPMPAITQGPGALPTPVAVPVVPAAPTTSATDSAEVSKQVADPDGPGCGWAFTGQVEPPFDVSLAESAFATDVESAKKAMSASWRRWQTAKVAYFADYATYSRQARKYKSYAAEVELVRTAWAMVNGARATYYAALADYDAAMEAFKQWAIDRAAAKASFRDAKQVCATPPPAEAPTLKPPAPTASPTAAPSAPTASPTAAPTASPTATSSPPAPPSPTGPSMICPPIRPTILARQPPTVPASPRPAPEAQLPTPTTIPAG